MIYTSKEIWAWIFLSPILLHVNAMFVLLLRQLGVENTWRHIYIKQMSHGERKDEEIKTSNIKNDFTQRKIVLQGQTKALSSIWSKLMFWCSLLLFHKLCHQIVFVIKRILLLKRFLMKCKTYYINSKQYFEYTLMFIFPISYFTS